MYTNVYLLAITALRKLWSKFAKQNRDSLCLQALGCGYVLFGRE